jgi:hypothetical protein
MGDQLSATHAHTQCYLGFHLEQAGDYYFELRVDGQTASRIPLYVRQMASPPA